MSRPFLTAHWTNLILANFQAPAELLRPHLPPGSELDTPDNAPGLHLLSLVAFHFSHTRVYGIPVPTGGWFPELNLRFYVRRGERRATVFLREYVPAPLIALGARLLYFQPYFLARLHHEITHSPEALVARTRFDWRGRRGELHVRARPEPFTPPADSQAHFLKEHYWGFDRDPLGRGFRYRVEHPVWRLFPVEEAHVGIDPGELLGGAWREVAWPAALHSVLLAEGSAVTVYGREPLAR